MSIEFQLTGMSHEQVAPGHQSPTPTVQPLAEVGIGL
jgi:hypothetical protein